ncbi:hypothetical protein HPNQ4099_1555 [Helicobacter pylori NQ4099]|uniref:Uncharacterized protein n=2 Tax=Helicobacter pylori TaxID=210 RepID=I9Q167_HELPX|nr:hypothetical protein [Helicobacter pylori]EJB28331.1 hypothetical protein HPNQ4099_1555 [Helicobacter pylori NQ4099]EJB33307.1 hypothetical protein HPNQ4076_1304 [Helicobacter pylori NQ4076]MCQ2747377.1 hypothetical protein [Helicobacter pylori]OOC33300.1 hypothetical protein BZK24_05770 [Helicobacter pylori]QTP05454.1 hypothetical protein J4T92_06510 [Helicobacter pylori]
MAQLEDLKAHEKYNLLLCLFKSGYYNDPENRAENKPFKQACEECTLTFFRPRMDKVAEHKDFEKVRQADYAVAIVYEKSNIEGVKIQRSVFALKIDHFEVDDGGSLVIYGVCAQKGSQEYEELVNKNAWCLTNSPRLNNSMKLIKRKS